MRLCSGHSGKDAMAKTADVVIIGAGVMGASIAFNLARRGVTNVAVWRRTSSPPAPPAKVPHACGSITRPKSVRGW